MTPPWWRMWVALAFLVVVWPFPVGPRQIIHLLVAKAPLSLILPPLRETKKQGDPPSLTSPLCSAQHTPPPHLQPLLPHSCHQHL